MLVELFSRKLEIDLESVRDNGFNFDVLNKLITTQDGLHLPGTGLCCFCSRKLEFIKITNRFIISLALDQLTFCVI